MLERNVKEGCASFGEHLCSLAERGVHMDAPAPAIRDPGGHREVAVDENRAPVADEEARGHGRKAVPSGEEAARFVERRTDEPAVDDAGARLVTLAEGKRRLVALDPLLGRKRKMNALGVLTAAPTKGVVVRRNLVYRSPPRSK